MKIDFVILWIDDQPAAVKSSIERVGGHVSNEGFSLQVREAIDLDTARTFIGDSYFVDEIDLVVVDYDLGSGAGGEIAIGEIQNVMPYKDIVFYSAVAPAMLKNQALEAGAEGVYTSTRQDLAETVIGIFDSLVKKVLDLENSRGIVMSATSDIDYICEHVIRSISADLSTDEVNNIVVNALENIDDRLGRLQTERAAIESEGTIEALLDRKELYSAVLRLRLLRKLVTDRFPDDENAGLRKSIGKYISDVVPQRNIHGHVRLVASGSHQDLIGFDGQTVSAEEMRELRLKLLRHRGEFQRLAALLGLGS